MIRMEPVFNRAEHFLKVAVFDNLTQEEYIFTTYIFRFFYGIMKFQKISTHFFLLLPMTFHF
jgi:hypothetical protein